MADLEQSLEELEAVKQSFKANINNTGISASSVEFRNMPELIKGMEKKLPHQTKEVEPSTSVQDVVADTGYKLTGVKVNAVTSAIDSNIKATNIRKGVDILGVTGTLEEHVTPKLQSKTVYPTTNLQQVTADSGYDGLSKVDVSAVTSAIDANIKAENIKSGTTILGVTGTLEEGGGEIQGYNVKSIISEDGLTQTLKITTGTGGGDLIDVDELPTENVEDDKIYRVSNSVGDYYLYDSSSGTTTGLRESINYKTIFVSSIDSVSDPIYSADIENDLTIYIDTTTYIAYFFSLNDGTRYPLSMVLGFDESLFKGRVDDLSSITEDGLYYYGKTSYVIGVPNENHDKQIYDFNGTEWKPVKGTAIEASTDEEMANALTEANVGRVYKFTGTSDTYETDAIYIVSEV
jgi:hypothetical protein